MIKECLTYDDVSIIPNYSDIEHRDQCQIQTKISKNYSIDVPVVSAPMDTVTGLQMCITMANLGGMGFLHRFASANDQFEWVKEFKKQLPDKLIGASVGVTGEYLAMAQGLVNCGADIILIDVAHGHHKLVEIAIKEIKNKTKGKFDLIAGNVATQEGAESLFRWGADGVRCGVGGGSMCSTRLQTGVGIPMITSIQDCVKGSKFLGNIPVIADGGIRHVGDIAKALACGASSVMIGSLLSGTKETPGDLLRTGIWPNEVLYKRYSGSASLESKINRGESGKHIEGYSKQVRYKGHTSRIIQDVIDGVKSSMSYVGAQNLMQFELKAKLVKVTNAGQIEASPHGLNL